MAINKRDEVRASNFELLRIVSMFMIIILHIASHGISNYIDVSLYLTNFEEFFYYFIRSLSIVSVTIYVMISGYFLSKSTFKLSKLWSLFFETSFFSTVIYLFGIIIGYVEFTYVSLLKSFVVVLSGEYWFVTVYFIMYALSPFLNKLIQSLTQKEFSFLLIIAFMICCIWQFISHNELIGVSQGYGLGYFIFLYLIAAYIREYKFITELFGTKVYLFIYFSIAIVNTLIYTIGNIDRVYSYNSPLILIMSCCIFIFFKKLELKSLNINFVSRYVFGIYLIHEHYVVRAILWEISGIIEDIISGDSTEIIIKMIGYSIVIFISCWILSFVITKIFDLLYSKQKTTLHSISGKSKINKMVD